MYTQTTSKPINYKEVYFNHLSLKKVIGNPKYANLWSINKHIKENATSAPCTLIGSRKNYLGLFIDTVTYNHTTPNNLYLIPTNPAPPGINKGTAAKITEGVRQKNIVVITFYEAKQIDLPSSTISNQPLNSLYSCPKSMKKT